MDLTYGILALYTPFGDSWPNKAEPLWSIPWACTLSEQHLHSYHESINRLVQTTIDWKRKLTLLTQLEETRVKPDESGHGNDD